MHNMKTLKEYLLESPASESALRLGLRYYGFGKYGKNRRVTHHSEFGYLRKVKDPYHAGKGESPLTHLEHIEDEIFNNGTYGVRNAMDYLHGVEALMKGHDDRVRLVTKIDGSPSLTFFGGDTPWVSTKSAFNTHPKINYTNSDIEQNHGHIPGLPDKLKVALKHVSKLKPITALQGDLLFTNDSVKVETIDNIKYYTFKPNTIKYAIPVDSDMGREVARAKMGIAIHTKYHDISKPERQPASINDYTKHPDIFVLPIETNGTNLDIRSYVSHLGKLFNRTPKEAFEYAKQNTSVLKQYINATVKSNTPATATDFKEWYESRAKSGISKLKSDRGRNGRLMKLNMELNDIDKNAESIDAMFKLHVEIQNLKNNIIDTLDSAQAIRQFYDTPEGMQETTPEGYVVIGATGSLKLVRRHSFSRMNRLRRDNVNESNISKVKPRDFAKSAMRILKSKLSEDALLEKFGMAAVKARNMGLKYYGFGRWGKNRTVTHRQEGTDVLKAVKKVSVGEIDSEQRTSDNIRRIISRSGKWDKLGSGVQSSVYKSIEDDSTAVKVSGAGQRVYPDAQTPDLAWLHFLMDHGDKSQHFVKIYNVNADDVNVLQVRLERLKPFNYGVKGFEWLLLNMVNTNMFVNGVLDTSLPRYKSIRKKFNELIKTTNLDPKKNNVDDILEAIYAVKKLMKDYGKLYRDSHLTLDLHPGNFMVRDGVLVITDPYYTGQ